MHHEASSSIELSLVLACYNESPYLTENVRAIIEVLEATRISYELICVDDASQDRTWELIERLAADLGVRVRMQTIRHAENTGRGGAVRDGFYAAHGDIVGYLDVDLEVPAHYLVPCVLAIRQGADAVIGKRIYTLHWQSFDRYLLSKGYAWLVRQVLRLPGLTDTESGCKFFRRARILSLLKQCRATGWFWDTEIMAWCHMAALQIVEVPCVFLRRADKHSSVKPIRDSVDYFVKLLRFRAGMAARRATAIPVHERAS